MTGTAINAVAIVAAILFARSGGAAPAPSTQSTVRRFVAAAAAYTGASGVWHALNGPPAAIARQLLVAVIALLLGNLTGRIFGLQRALDRAGTRLGPKLPRIDALNARNESWFALAILLFLNPLSIPGAVEDGLGGRWVALAAKSCLDGMALAAYGRYLTLRGGLAVLLTVCGIQAAMAAAMISMKPWLAGRSLEDSILAVTGLLILCAVPALAGIRKARLANLVPALAWGPVITALWHV